jgi:excisionase family DNA binding protein
MTQNSARNDYFRMFRSYPDVVHVDELREMLGGIGRTTAYALLKSGRIEAVKMGRVYLIPKINVIRFLCESEK